MASVCGLVHYVTQLLLWAIGSKITIYLYIYLHICVYAMIAGYHHIEKLIWRPISVHAFANENNNNDNIQHNRGFTRLSSL